MLNSGHFYAFANGYDQQAVCGTLHEVESALGLGSSLSVASPITKTWNVRMRFQYPAWDEMDGLCYSEIRATSKSGANAAARRRASVDGHLSGGKGRVTFTAVESP